MSASFAAIYFTYNLKIKLKLQILTNALPEAIPVILTRPVLTYPDHIPARAIVVTREMAWHAHVNTVKPTLKTTCI